MLFVFIFLGLCIDVMLAAVMSSAYLAKGYDSGTKAFLLCFFFGIVGYLYVIAVPDLTMRGFQIRVLEQLELLNSEKIAEKIEKAKKEREEREEQRRENQRYIDEKAEQARMVSEEIEKKRLERIEKYWSEHEEEKNKLISKRDEIIHKLDELGPFDGSTRKQLLIYLENINGELEKDR